MDDARSCGLYHKSLENRLICVEVLLNPMAQTWMWDINPQKLSIEQEVLYLYKRQHILFER